MDHKAEAKTIIQFINTGLTQEGVDCLFNMASKDAHKTYDELREMLGKSDFIAFSDALQARALERSAWRLGE